MPEYYLTSAEKEIFEKHCNSMITSFNLDNLTENIDVIELGAGDGMKSLVLLKSLIKENKTFQYIPVDISRHSLDALATRVRKELPSISVFQQEGDYLTALNNTKRLLSDNWSCKNRIVLFLGNSIGNMVGNEANNFISELANYLIKGDVLVLGVDLIKSDDVILAAYSGPRNLDFKLNILKRINEELGGNFNLDQFSNNSTYGKEEGILRDYIMSNERQEVYIRDIDTTFQIEKGEMIQVDMSCKYDDHRVNKLLNHKKLEYVAKFNDSRDFFADYIYVCI
jgi:uncharacterized SAM-dependent methyltransferase